jgi:hypothetical protein
MAHRRVAEVDEINSAIADIISNNAFLKLTTRFKTN